MAWFASSKKTPNAQASPQYTGISLQTSAAGLPITIFWGKTRLAPNLIWAPGGEPAFHTIPHTDNQSGGSKGFGGGGCFAAETLVAVPGGHQPIGEIRVGDPVWCVDPETMARVEGKVVRVWKHDVARETHDKMLRVFFPGGAIHVTENHYLWKDGVQKIEAKDWRVGDELTHEDGRLVAITEIRPAADVEFTWNLTIEPHHNFFAGGILAHNGFGGGGGKDSVSYTYTQAVLLSLGEGEVSDVPTVYADKSTTTVEALGLSLFNGTAAQGPFGYVTVNYPSEARPYAFTSYLATGAYDLGSSVNLPNHSFECVRDFATATPDVPDASMADIIPDLLTSTQYGLGMTADQLGDLSAYRTYTRAAGLWFSPALTQQERVADIIDRAASLTNSWIFWDGTELAFVPLGDQPLSANGAVYAPLVSPVYHFGYDDFIADPGEDPISVDIADPADCANHVELEIKNRAKSYNSDPVKWSDDALIDQFGVVAASVTQAHEFCDADAAYRSAALIGQRSAYIRRKYAWKAGFRFCWLKPGKIVTLTDPHIGLARFPVRIQTIDDGGSDDDTLSFVAEEFPGAIGTATLFSPQAPTTQPLNMRAAPGDVNAPAIVEPTADASGGVPQVWIGISGGENFGGADVYISFDLGETYSRIGSVSNSARQGLLTAILASHADPDSSNTLSVDLAESQGALDGTATHDDADAFRTLALVGLEIIAYGQSTPGMTTYAYDLDYLRRGLYGTTIASHGVGATFTRLDGAIFRMDLPAQYVGSTLYLKFVSFNKFGLEHQQIADGVAYTYSPTGAGFGGGPGGTPTTPTGLTATPGTHQNVLAWSANPVTDNVTSYLVYAAPGLGQAFGSASLVQTINALGWTHTGLGSADPWTYFLVARNAAGDSGHTSGVDCTTL